MNLFKSVRYTIYSNDDRPATLWHISSFSLYSFCTLYSLSIQIHRPLNPYLLFHVSKLSQAEKRRKKNCNSSHHILKDEMKSVIWRHILCSSFSSHLFFFFFFHLFIHINLETCHYILSYDVFRHV